MSGTIRRLVILTLSGSLMAAAAGCASDGGYYGGTSLRTGYYSGPDWYDPYYGRPYYGGGTVIVRPGYGYGYRPGHGNRPGHGYGPGDGYRPGHGQRPGHLPPGAMPRGGAGPGGMGPAHLPARPRPRAAR